MKRVKTRSRASICFVSAAVLLLVAASTAVAQVYLHKPSMDQDDPQHVRPCHTLNNLVEMTTDGSIPPEGIIVTYEDILPPELETPILIYCAAGATCTLESDRITVTGYRLKPNLNEEILAAYDWHTNCATIDATEIRTQGHMTGDGIGVYTDDDGNPANGINQTTFPVCLPRFSTPTVAIVDNNGGTLESGDTVTVTVTATNDGCEDAADVFVEDNVDETYFSNINAPAGTYNGEAIHWNPRAVAVGETATFTFTAAVECSPGDRVCNGAQVMAYSEWNAESCDPVCWAPTSEACVVCGASQPVLQAAATWDVDGGGELVPFTDPIIGTVTVTNTSAGAVTNVVVVDAVDIVRLDEITPRNGGVFDPAAGTVTWTVGDLASGGAATVAFTALVKCAVNGDPIADQTEICNDSITVDSDQTGPMQVLPPACLRVNRPILTIAAAKSGADPLPGESVNFDITLCNAGTGTAVDVGVRDHVDAGNTGGLVEPPSSIGQGGVWFHPNIEWFGTSLSPATPGGPTCTHLTYAVTVRQGTPAGTSICEQAGIIGENYHALCRWGLPDPAPELCFTVAGEAAEDYLLSCCGAAASCRWPLTDRADAFPRPPCSPSPCEKSFTEGSTQPLCSYQVEQTSDANSFKVVKTPSGAPGEMTFTYE
jgi:hypothetical protein